MGILMLFLDGVGIGSRDPEINPIYGNGSPLLASMIGNLADGSSLDHPSPETISLAIDANLGVDGLPQSGTGQTALFTGINAAKILGRHFGPYPHSAIRPLVETENFLGRLKQADSSVCFANAFPQRFFDHIEKRKAHVTVTTLSCMACGIPLRRADDLRRGEALSADITGLGWHQLGYPDMVTTEPVAAGRRLASLAGEYDFVLFEYWKTDHAGHSMDHAEAREVLTLLDGLLAGIVERIRSENTLLVVTSDHGNIEDLSVKVHTRNPVPLILHGSGAARMAEMIHENPTPDLTTIAPGLLRFLSEKHDP